MLIFTKNTLINCTDIDVPHNVRHNQRRKKWAKYVVKWPWRTKIRTNCVWTAHKRYSFGDALTQSSRHLTLVKPAQILKIASFSACSLSLLRIKHCLIYSICHKEEKIVTIHFTCHHNVIVGYCCVLGFFFSLFSYRGFRWPLKLVGVAQLFLILIIILYQAPAAIYQC